MGSSLQVAFSIAGVIVVIIGAYYATYYISVKASGQSRGRSKGINRNIILRERFAISKDKSFCVVEIAGKIYVVAVTNQSMTLLDTLKAEEFEQTVEEYADTAAHKAWSAAPAGSFSGKLVNILASYIARKNKKTNETSASASDDGGGAKNGAFADSMRSAMEKDGSGQPDRTPAAQADDPEGE